jgi:hypothetical protein
MHRKWIAVVLLLGCAGVFFFWPGREVALTPPVVAVVETPRQTAAVTELREWIREAANKPGLTRVKLNEGRRVALERRETMSRLMREKPAEALAQGLSWSEWVALPEEVRALVERPFSDTVEFQVLPSCPPRERATNYVHPHRVVIGDKAFDGFVFGSKAQMTSKERLRRNRCRRAGFCWMELWSWRSRAWRDWKGRS